MFTDEMKKLSDADAAIASEAREKFYRFFDENGVKYASNNLSKPYLHDLSPGCRTCVAGTWSCLYINTFCTRKCFFCTREQSKENDNRPQEHRHLLSAEGGTSVRARNHGR